MEERKTRVTVSFDITLEEHYDLVEKIFDLDKNFKLNQKEAFDWAVENNDTELIKLLIQSGIDGYAKIVKLLIEAGADVTANDNYAIRYASANGHTEVVKLLIKAGANVTAHNCDAIKSALENGHNEIAKLLIETAS